MSRPEVHQVYIVRHGQTDLNLRPEYISGRSSEVPLNDMGHQQAVRLGRAALQAGIVPDIVRVTPAKRTQQTAHTALASMGCSLEPVIDEGFHELGMGEWEGKLRTEAYDEFTVQRILRDPRNAKAPGGESINEVEARTLNSTARLITHLQAIEGETAMVFGHGLSTRILAGHHLGWEVETIRDHPTPNCSVSLFEHDRYGWRVVYVGQQLMEASSVK